MLLVSEFSYNKGSVLTRSYFFVRESLTQDNTLERAPKSREVFHV